MQPPRHRPGHFAWQQPAAAGLAIAPPHWAVAAPPRPPVGRRARRIALLAAATCGFAAIARAQVATGDSDAGGTGGGTGSGTGTSAATGTTGGGATTTSTPAASDATPGSLRATVESVLPGTNPPLAGATTAPAWIVTPGISLQEEWTDNTFQTATDRKSNLITVVTPSIAINGNTPRVQANLYYAPDLQLYTPDASQNQVGQNLGADGLFTLAPDEFYIRTTGYASVQSANGATAASGTTTLNKSNAVQTYDFSIQPYVTHHFGGWGTAQAGVSMSETTEGAVGSSSTFQNLSTRQEFATFKSGENFGRLSSTVSLSATQDAGTGALQGATQNYATYQAGYAITRDIIALASLGWEDIRYTGAGAPHYNDATWSFGVELLPNPDSSITVTYGHQNGATAAAVNASYAPTATIRLFATYSAGVTTAAQSLNNVLSAANFDANGHPVDSTTGAALLTNTNFFGFNNTVYQSKNLTLTAAWLLPRDAFQLSVSQQTQTPVGSAGQTAAAAAGNVTFSEGVAATKGTTGTISWQHDLSPVVVTNLTFQYGVLNNAIPLQLTNGVLTATGKQIQNSTLLSVNAAVNWKINETLSSTLQYSYTSNDYSNGLPGVAANLVVLGLHKTF